MKQCYYQNVETKVLRYDRASTITIKVIHVKFFMSKREEKFNKNFTLNSFLVIFAECNLG